MDRYIPENLKTTLLKRNAEDFIKQTDYGNGTYEQSETKSRSKEPELHPQTKYMDIIIKHHWACDPDPEYLFDITKWKKWIIRLAHKLNESEKFSNPTTLHSYAITLMAMVCDDKFKYLHIASNYLDRDQKTRLYKMKELREDNEDELLAQMASGQQNFSDNSSGCNGFNIGATECSVVKDFSNLPLKSSNGNVTNSTTSICSMDAGAESPERIFEDMCSPMPDQMGFNYNSSCLSRNNSEALSRKRNRKNDNSNSLHVHYSENKKYCNENDTSRYNKLSIKKFPRNSRYATKGDNVQNNRSMERFSEPRPCNKFAMDTTCFEKETDTKPFVDSAKGYEYSLSGDDLVIENPTPPCSPAGTVIIAEPDSSRHKIFNESFRNVNTSCSASTTTTSSTTGFKRDYYNTNTNQKLKSTDSKFGETKRIKGIRELQSFNEQLTRNVTNKVAEEDEYDFDLPDVEPAEAIIDQDKENYPVSVDEIAVKYPKPPTAPALTLEIFEALKTVLDKPPKDKIVTGFSLYILQEDLAIYNKDTEWLNDRNIDFYLEIIRERSTKNGFPSVYIFHSFFYALLTGNDGGYEVVQETTGDEDIFKYDIVFFPVNLNQHWRLVAVKFREKSLKCYDSMRHDNSEILKNIGTYLRKEYRRKRRNNYSDDQWRGYTSEDDRMSPVSFIGVEEPLRTRTFFDSSMWNVENVASETIPQQKNAIDCGIFVLQYAEYLSREIEFDFDQSHIPYFRKRMMYETLTKQILTPVGNENLGKP